MLAINFTMKLESLDQDRIVVITTTTGGILHIRSIKKIRHENEPDIPVLTTFSGFAMSAGAVVHRLQRIKTAANSVILVSYHEHEYFEIQNISAGKNSDMVTILLGLNPVAIEDSNIVNIR